MVCIYLIILSEKSQPKTHVETKKFQTQRNRVEWWSPRAGEWGQWEDVDQRVQISSYKINKFWGSNVQHSGYN